KRSVAVARRDRGAKEKDFIDKEESLKLLPGILREIQDTLLTRATEFRDANMVKIDSKDEFVNFFTPKNEKKPEIHAGFALCHWAGSNEDEKALATDYKVTLRCIPDSDEFAEEGTCFYTGQPSSRRVIFAKAY
ncbi:MAG: proline--tRNA ligase, partial [Verrucomicrobiota bacterium]